MASKPTVQKETTDPVWEQESKQSASDSSDSDYDSQSQDEVDENDSFSDDLEESELYNYGYFEGSQIATSTISEYELSHSISTTQLTPTIPSLSPLQIQVSTGANQTFTPEQFTFDALPEASRKQPRMKRNSSPNNQREEKRLEYHFNPNSKQVKPNPTIVYIGEMDTTSIPRSLPTTIYLDTSMPAYYTQKSTQWQTRNIFNADPNRISPTGLLRVDLFVYAVEANAETREQCAKSSHKRNMQVLNTPIERFHPDIWQVQHPQANNPVLSREYLESLPFYQEPYADSLSILRRPDIKKLDKVAYAVEELTQPIHTTPPTQQHSLSERGSYLLQCTEPIQFFEAIYRPYEITSLVEQTNTHRKQKKLFHFERVTYEEMRCFLGLLLWTSLVQCPSRRAYFKLSKVYQLPHFISHMTRNRFEQLFRMLHLANNNKIPQNLDSATRFKAKLGKQLEAICRNSTKLLTPARALSIDEMMVRFYGSSVIRQYIPAKPHKYGVKLWAICCSCCGYSLTQRLYLGSSGGT